MFYEHYRCTFFSLQLWTPQFTIHQPCGYIWSTHRNTICLTHAAQQVNIHYFTIPAIKHRLGLAMWMIWQCFLAAITTASPKYISSFHLSTPPLHSLLHSHCLPLFLCYVILSAALTAPCLATWQRRNTSISLEMFICKLFTPHTPPRIHIYLVRTRVHTGRRSREHTRTQAPVPVPVLPCKRKQQCNRHVLTWV